MTTTLVDNPNKTQKKLSTKTLVANNVNNTSEITQEQTLYAEPIAHIDNFTITNSLFTSWIVVFILIIISIIVKSKIREIPKGIQNLFEITIEEGESLCDEITGSRKITDKAFPIVFTIFIIVLLNNWIGILPLGGFGMLNMTEHGKIFIPFIRSGTSDINGTLSLAILSVIGANIFGIISIGLWKTFNRYVNLKALGTIFTKIIKDPMIIVVAPIMFLVGLIELVSEFAKLISLSFRLFGNIFAGEVLLASMGAILAYILPTPFIFLEIFVGIIQAFIFAILTLVYYTIASQDEEYEEERSDTGGEVFEASY